jgi:uncharacterized protein (DUF983 family)
MPAGQERSAISSVEGSGTGDGPDEFTVMVAGVVVLGMNCMSKETGSPDGSDEMVSAGFVNKVTGICTFRDFLIIRY